VGDDVPTPLVSIVIPCFNQGRYLGDAIASIQRQSHPNIEVLVVDDGSTDETARVAALHPALGYACQANAGTAAARNRGLRDTRGTFIVFLDADDRLLPDAIALGVAYLTSHPDVAFVAGHVRLIDEAGTPGIVPLQDHEPAGYAALLRWNHIWTPGVVMYRRSALAAAGAFDPSAGGSADFEVNVRLARRLPIACHHQVVLEYRQHGANMTGDPAHMLRSAVSVRRRERTHARRRDAHQAWRTGLRLAQAHFGDRLIDRIKGDLIAGRRARALRGLLCLLRYHPAGLARMAALREWPKLVARRWRTAPR
jgi:glycosyltransferase involved in cell wall biosynthesis